MFAEGGRLALGSGNSGQGHVKVVEDGNEFCQQGFVGKFDGFLFFAGGSFFVVIQVGRCPEELVAVRYATMGQHQ